MKSIERDGRVIEVPEQSPDETCLQGYVEADYLKIVSVFGEPGESDGYKVDAEWTIMTPDGIATIYNWKNGKNYLGARGLPTERIRNWNIGGDTSKVVRWITDLLYHK